MDTFSTTAFSFVQKAFISNRTKRRDVAMKKIIVTSLLTVLFWTVPVGLIPAVPHYPPEAYKACAGKKAGAAGKITNKNGTIIEGICADRDGRLVLQKTKWNNKLMKPSPVANKTCDGKKVGEETQFINPAGATVRGKCEKQKGKIVFRPYTPAQSNSIKLKPSPEAYKACEGKKEGEIAQFTNPRRITVKGKCGTLDGILVLQPYIPKSSSNNNDTGSIP
jgi:hypothetical protein